MRVSFGTSKSLTHSVDMSVKVSLILKFPATAEYGTWIFEKTVRMVPLLVCIAIDISLEVSIAEAALKRLHRLAGGSRNLIGMTICFWRRPRM